MSPGTMSVSKKISTGRSSKSMKFRIIFSCIATSVLHYILYQSTANKKQTSMSFSLLPIIQSQLVRYGTTTIMGLGCIGNAFVVVLFSKHYKNACAMYLLGAAVMNIIYLSLSVPLNVYTYEHGDPSLNSMAFCKLRYYLFHVWGQMSRYFIVLACIDRFALTNISASIRALSRTSIARCLMVIVTVFWHLFALHILIMTTIMSGRCGYFGLYSTLNSIYVLIFNCFIPPITMAIFGYLAFRSIKRLHSRVQAAGNANNNRIVIHRQDRNLLVMLLAEVSVYVVTMSLYPMITFEMAVTANVDKSLQRIQIESFIQFISLFLIYMNTSAPFYIYLAASRAFRDEFIELISNLWRQAII